MHVLAGQLACGVLGLGDAPCDIGRIENVGVTREGSLFYALSYVTFVCLTNVVAWKHMQASADTGGMTLATTSLQQQFRRAFVTRNRSIAGRVACAVVQLAVPAMAALIMWCLYESITRDIVNVEYQTGASDWVATTPHRLLRNERCSCTTRTRLQH